MLRILACASASLLAIHPVRAQESSQDPPSTTELEARIQALERRQAREVEDLRFELESLEAELERARRASAQPPAQSPNVFNPQITVFGNFLARIDDQPVYLDDDPSGPRIDDTMSLREVEVDLRAAIDPWADGVLILAFESEAPGEFEAGVEEGYATLKKLPLLDSAPAGLKLKVGRFRPSFGRFNRIHLHDLPSVDYPRSLSTFLGPEGYVQDGFSGQFFLPSPSDSSSLEATLELLGGGDLPVAGPTSASEIAGLARVGWFQETGEATNFDLGVSGWQDDQTSTLLGLDATWKWRPPVSGQYRSLLFGGELFAASPDDPSQEEALGWFAWSQYQFTRSTYLGVRFDRAEELEDASLVTDTWSAYLTYYTTEFLRFRLGLEHADSDLADVDGRNTAFFELNFVFGSHPAEPYWVNR